MNQTIKKTDSFTPNIREGTIPEITTEQYLRLLEGETLEVSEATAFYLIDNGYAVKVD